MRDTQVYKCISAIKNSIKSVIFLCTASHKKIWIQYVLWLEKFERVISVELYFFIFFFYFPFMYSILEHFAIRNTSEIIYKSTTRE